VGEDRWDREIASAYATRWPESFAAGVVDPMVDVLGDLAAGGPALELAVGTGRVAVPLHQRGVPVHGIDLSRAMLDELRTDPAARGIDVTLGDIATTTVGRRFTLVYLVANTIMNLTTQDEQVACFRNAAAHLEPGGRFVIDVVVPALRVLPPGENVRTFTMTPVHIGVDEYVDFVDQISWSHHWWFGPDGPAHFAAPFRYVWPSELDLMARLAGMSLVHRWGDWHRTPFTEASPRHVSTWEKGSG
jgi:SAM-dependent methyltransferase